MKQEIIPIGNRILVKPKEKEEKTKSGIILAGDKEEKQDQGIVISVGDGREVQKFKRDDILIFQRYGPAEIKVNKEKYIIIHIDEVFAIIKEVKCL